MANILVDIERKKYPHSGVGFFCKCLELGMMHVLDKSTIHHLSFYGIPNEREQVDYYPDRFWHKWYNPEPCGKDVVYITHQLQQYFGRVSRSPKYIVTLHDLNFLHEPLSTSQIKRRLSIVRTNLHRADIIVCISEYVSRDLFKHIELFDLKPNVQIEVIHNGLIFPDYIELPISNFLVPDRFPFLLSIGVLHQKKQQHLLLEMLPHLPEDFHLVLLFSSEHKAYRDELNGRISKLHLEKRVHFYKNLSDQEKLYLLQHCTAYLHPSIAEGFGIPPIEAMHCGRPTFLSQATSLPEIGGSEAYYFETQIPEDMARVLLDGLNDYKRDKSKGQRLREWSNRYDYRRMALDYLSLI